MATTLCTMYVIRYIIYSILCAILHTLYIAMATGCGHGYGCGWGHILYSPCSMIYTLYYMSKWSYASMSIRLYVGCIIIRLMAVWLYGYKAMRPKGIRL